VELFECSSNQVFLHSFEADEVIDRGVVPPRANVRLGVPAEIVVRMLLLKHLRNWSFDELEREVRPNLLYREFTRVAAGIVPDAKTMGSQARALGPEAIKQIHQRVVALAVENKVVQGRKMRVDTTVVETNIHYRMSRVKLVYSAGVNPVGARVRSPVAWIVRRKETESRKSIDKAILGMGSKSSGRNESKRTGGLENVNPRGRALGSGAKAAWNRRNLTDAARHSGGVVATAR
jgi:hypothetical protein